MGRRHGDAADRGRERQRAGGAGRRAGPVRGGGGEDGVCDRARRGRRPAAVLRPLPLPAARRDREVDAARRQE